MRVLAGYSWRATAGGAPQAAVWVAGELDAGVAARDERWADGADVFVEIRAAGGPVVDGAHQTVTRESRSFVVRLPAGGGVGPGEYEIRFTSRASGSSVGSTETLRVTVPKLPPGDEPFAGQSVIFRRVPSNGAWWMPAGDLRFRRQEHIKVETAVLGAAASVTIRVLDRTGNALLLPVVAAERDEGGTRIVSGDVALAPLTVGDYLLETAVTRGTTTRVALAAFRIIP